MTLHDRAQYSPIRVMAAGGSIGLKQAVDQADQARASIDEARRALRESPSGRLTEGESVHLSFADLLDRQDWFNDRMVQTVLLEWTEAERPTIRDGQRIMYNGADAVFNSFGARQKAWYVSELQADDFPKQCPDQRYNTMANARASVIAEMLRVYRSGSVEEKQEAMLESPEQFHNALIALRQMHPEWKAIQLDFNTLPSQDQLVKIEEISSARARDCFAQVITGQADRIQRHIQRHIGANESEPARGETVIDQQRYCFEFKPGVMYEHDQPKVYSASTRNRNGERVKLDFHWGWSVDNLIYDLQVGDTKLHYRTGDKAIHVENTKTGLNKTMLVPSRDEVDAERNRQTSYCHTGFVGV